MCSSQLVVIFTSFNTFRLILKERSEMCQRDGRLGVWCETGDVTSHFYDTFEFFGLAKLSFKLTNKLPLLKKEFKKLNISSIKYLEKVESFPSCAEKAE